MATSQIISVGRWLCVIPLGIVSAVVAAVAVHLVVMVTLGGWSPSEPVIEIRDPDHLRRIELAIQSLIGPLAFVYGSAGVAPRFKVTVAIAMSVLILCGMPVLVSWINSTLQGLRIERGWLHISLNVVGVAIGTFLVFRESRQSVSDHCNSVNF